MEGIGDDQCYLDNDCQINDAPTVYNLTADTSNYCVGIPGAGVASFEWVYYDIEGDTQSQFELQIDDNSDFSSPEVDRVVNTSYSGVTSGSAQQQLVLVKTIATIPGGDYISYGQYYYWRVRVKDSLGNESNWVYYNGPNGIGTQNLSGATSYIYGYEHPAPAPHISYSFSGASPQLNEDILFSDGLSVCYNASGAISCRTLSSCYGVNCYTWDFDDGPSYDHTMGNVTHSYSAVGNYTPSLTICDEIGCCPDVTNVPVGLNTGRSGPTWKEITPF